MGKSSVVERMGRIYRSLPHLGSIYVLPDEKIRESGIIQTKITQIPSKVLISFEGIFYISLNHKSISIQTHYSKIPTKQNPIKIRFFHRYFLLKTKKYILLCRSNKGTLFNGVMAAQQILVLLVLVRIQVEQQIRLSQSDFLNAGSVAQLDRATAF